MSDMMSNDELRNDVMNAADQILTKLHVLEQRVSKLMAAANSDREEFRTGISQLVARADGRVWHTAEWNLDKKLKEMDAAIEALQSETPREEVARFIQAVKEIA